ncbi:alpha-1,2-fucosyltransferase [Fibrella forsythiae]|uniref:Alpha-1,2-fucosyltransferase n=1 Tax=Fibrella forsythiae TaxID=2817061 RepID=A0ABS3JJT0_9BACT|nr:alpha-1,2-fucosyltransferase [Fibrella forsythiae]MBO0950258.1 alpha-1,2-fucosyltransferase [Fibrella forsythiae]
MVIAKITSGLGNQLFQYALGRHLALQNNTSLWFDLRYFHQEYETDTPRKFKLDRFNVAYNLLDKSPWLYASKATRLLPNRSLRPLVETRYETEFHFEPRMISPTAPLTILWGFWQSERYFEASTAQIRQELTFRRAEGDTFRAYKQQIEQANVPVSVHIRRGDYVTHPEFSQSFGFLGLNYYQTAITYLTSRLPNATLFFFSDDPDWVRANLNTAHPNVLVANTGPDADVDDLQLMSLCHHHIIANSSFSWWGAWLDPRPDKIVIAPQRWFANKPWDTKDLVPASWLRM